MDIMFCLKLRKFCGKLLFIHIRSCLSIFGEISSPEISRRSCPRLMFCMMFTLFPRPCPWGALQAAFCP